MQVRDVFAMREHYGWAHYLTQKLPLRSAYTARIVGAFQARLSARTDARSAAFDETYGTETFRRGDVAVQEGVPAEELSWGYGPINQDFFREIMRAIPVPHGQYTFVDVGAGKGAAIMLASEFGFRRYLGVELSGDLLEVARRNVAAYQARGGNAFEPEWIQHDFFQWPIPREPTLVFLNNPFPEELSLRAVQRIEAALAEQPRELVLVYRKAPAKVGAHLHGSRLWRPLRLAPYWRVYASRLSDAA
jgi:hypothetical protein